MIVLGLDPSLTNCGWALHDTEAPVGDPSRCVGRGRIRTSSKMEFIDRYVFIRDALLELLRDQPPDKVGQEFPVFGNLYSEGMYGLFLYVCEALKEEHQDVVFFTPLQIKAHARDSIVRPPKWKMDKPDMVEAAKADTGGGRWNHNEADAYLVGVLAGRFWKLYEGLIQESDLTPTEARYFTRVHQYVRGPKAGKVKKTGTIHREDDRFFRWSI
jgi:hypothetical protein